MAKTSCGGKCYCVYKSYLHFADSLIAACKEEGGSKETFLKKEFS